MNHADAEDVQDAQDAARHWGKIKGNTKENKYKIKLFLQDFMEMSVP